MHITTYILDSYCFQTDVAYPGNDGKIILNTASATHCQWECQQDATCLYFSYGRTDGRCVFKTVNNPSSSPSVTSGPKFCMQTTSKYSLEQINKTCLK